MNKDIIKTLIEKNKIKYLKLQFTDMVGTLKSVEVPTTKLDEALDGKIIFDGSSIEGFVRIMEADMNLVPDLDTFLIIPSDEKSNHQGYARIICDVYLPNGKPFDGDPRYILKKSLEKLKKYNIGKLMIGLEPEFYLLDKNSKAFIDNNSYFDMGISDISEKCRHEIVLELEKLGYQVEASHHEVGPSQNEITFKYDEALKTCDRIQLFKHVVKEVASRNNLIATFMPKPFKDYPGSGMHVNCSLFDDFGNNLFYDPSQKLGLSTIAYKWISGILNRARECSLVTNPIINSYKRICSGFEAPCHICWSDANRSTLIRIPNKRGLSTRCEIRNVDPFANPYLMISVILESGLEGINSCEKIIQPIYENIFELTEEERKERRINSLPENLKEAIHEFEHSKFLMNILGSHLFEKYLFLKKIEWDEYKNLIHNWEIEKYL